MSLDQKEIFLTSKGTPFYSSTFWQILKSQLWHFTTLSSLTQGKPVNLSNRNQSDFQSAVDKQKNQLTLDLMGQNLALC